MNSNFDIEYPRRNSNSYKWDTPSDSDVLPMWVADMDFKTAPCIVDALRTRVEHGIFGYTYVPDEYYGSVVRWFKEKHDVEFLRDWFIYTSGVVPALSAVIKALTNPGDRVITQTPAYNCFFSSIRNNGCELVSNPLIYSDNRYFIDFDLLEQQSKDPGTKLLLLCNPHNPSGRVWTPEELRRIGDICVANGVIVVADEIHCELTYNGHNYTPYASLGEKYAAHSVTCNSPSKAFNIAGLQIANIITPDKCLREKIDKAININEVCDVNPFGVAATIAAYTDGDRWLGALKDYIYGNYVTFRRLLSKMAPRLKVVDLEGTYLAWINIVATGLSSEEFTEGLLSSQKLMLNPGTMYGEGGEGFVRVNLAASRRRVVEAAERIARFVVSSDKK